MTTVAVEEVLWLVTAKPTYTVSAIGTVSVPMVVHFTPSVDV